MLFDIVKQFIEYLFNKRKRCYTNAHPMPPTSGAYRSQDVIEKTTPLVWTETARALGWQVSRTKRGTTERFTLKDSRSGAVMGIALLDTYGAREIYLMDLPSSTPSTSLNA